jgi:hypothetical protein
MSNCVSGGGVKRGASFSLDLNWMELYMDDSGNRLPDHKPDQGRGGVMDCFALGGILFEARNIPLILEAYSAFCGKWKIDYPLVSNKIRTKSGSFAWVGTLSECDKADFYQDIARMIEQQPFIAIACVVHRPGYNARYDPLYGEKRWMLCKTAYGIAVERAAKFASRANLRLRVHFEQTGKREDRAFIAYQRDLKKIGMPFAADNSAKYQPMDAASFRKVLLGDPLSHTKASRFCQLADLVLYPMAMGRYNANYRPYEHLRNAN